MANSEATDTRNIICDIPDKPGEVVTFDLLSFLAANDNEAFPQHSYSLTLNETGQGTQALPVSENAWLWEIGLPDGNKPKATLAAGGDIQLTAWLSAALSTETPNDLLDTFALKAGIAAAADGEILQSDGDNAEGSGYLSSTSLRLHNFTATAAPAVTDDSDDGYAPGSHWIDVTNDKEYVCLDATVGAAVWTETTGAGGGGISNIVEDTTPQLGGDLDAQGNDITDMGNITFKTGAAGGVLRTGTANADKFILAAYDVNDGVYRTVIELDAGNDVVMQLIADYLALEDAADTTKHVEWDLSGATTGTATTLIFVQTAARSITFPDETGTVLTNQGGTLAGDFNMADNLITRSAQKDTAEVPNNLGNVSGTMTIDYTDGQYVSATLTGNVTTLTINNWPASDRVGYLTLELTPGGNTVSWTGVTWVGDEPTLDGTVHFVTIWTRDGGTTKYAVHTGSTA